MYLAPEINKSIEAIKFDELTKHGEIRRKLQRALKPWGVRVRVHQDPEILSEDFACSGSFDSEKDHRPIEIVLHFTPYLDDFQFTRQTRRNFNFMVSQVLQHELIHQYQYSRRPVAAREQALYYDIKAGKRGNKEHMDYLAELDEIDCYAHDIALEIRHYYPRTNPYKVLGSINRRYKVWSWRYYRDTFRHSQDWSEVRDRLLKKVYLWLQHV